MQRGQVGDGGVEPGGVQPVEVDLEDVGGDGPTVPQEPTQVQEVVVNVPSEDVKQINMEVNDGSRHQTV